MSRLAVPNGDCPEVRLIGLIARHQRAAAPTVGINPPFKANEALSSWLMTWGLSAMLLVGVAGGGIT